METMRQMLRPDGLWFVGLLPRRPRLTYEAENLYAIYVLYHQARGEWLLRLI